MDVDKLLEKIEQDTHFQMLDGVYCLQGNPELKLFQVRPIDEVYTEALNDFEASIVNPFMTLAISKDIEELWRYKTEAIDNRVKFFEGDILRDTVNFFVVEGEAARNELHITTVNRMCDDNLLCYKLGANRNWMLMGVLVDIEHAQTHIEFIRAYLRNEDPK